MMMKIQAIFWVVMPCNGLVWYYNATQHFGGTYCHHLQGEDGPW